MSNLVEGLWDCPYCNQKGIGGLKKQCPGCGHPQDEGTKFYLGEQKNYLDAKVAQNYGKGADWTCSFCGGLNRYHVGECVNCGAPKESKSGDYFDNPKKMAEQKQSSTLSPKYSPASSVKTQDKERGMRESLRTRKRFAWIAALLIALMTIILWPKNTAATLQDKSWSREIQIEAYKTVKESDWAVPAGGREYDHKKEIHHYDHVIDHYEDVSVQKSRDVLDGYDTHTNYIDNGDGTFKEETVQTPRYRTEYYTETERQPVYKDVPIYKTKYYYEIEKWIYDHSVKTDGKKEDPYWGDVVLADQEREGERIEKYVVTFVTKKNKVYNKDVSLEEWQKFELGEKRKIVVQMGKIKKIK
ncbi:MAG: hypothetical protein Q4D51_02755 [Eubacteriales bacterium]|nr:hypothetical protein [Eubacteriales bacterium]